MKVHNPFRVALVATLGVGVGLLIIGGIQTLSGPIWGAALFVWLHDQLSRDINYWRAAIGAVILLLVLAFPGGITGLLKTRASPMSGK